MNRQEAYSIVTTVLERYLAMDFDDVLSRIGTTASEEFLASSSVRYAIEVSVSWADSGHRAVLIIARIDDQNAFHYELIEERIYVRNPQPKQPCEGGVSVSPMPRFCSSCGYDFANEAGGSGPDAGLNVSQSLQPLPQSTSS